jgi:succinyl-CoA synthetase beta subunit
MNIHEYQAKDLLRRYNVPVLFGKPVFSAEEAGTVTYRDFVTRGISTVVLKSQIHAGGRGKGVVHDVHTNQPIELFGKLVRGVTVIHDGNIADKVYQLARATFSNKLVTIQTGDAGKIVRRMFIEEGCSIVHEYYCSILLDRQTSQNIIMVSTEGGMDIEEVAEHSPEKILREYIDPSVGLQSFQARRMAFGLGLSGEPFKSFCTFIAKLYHAYEDMDCSMMEVNPLVVNSENKFIALDAKVNFDDNALFRHPDFMDFRDITEEDPLEVEASKFNLNYIKLDGNVGCMVNGAGLAMATMDTIKLFGGQPANFLDVGGGATAEKVTEAFKIMLKNKSVKAILVNIFGGIMRCDVIAEGVVTACKAVNLSVPLVVRMKGTNEEQGKKILADSGLPIISADSMAEAATKVVAATQGK